MPAFARIIGIDYSGAETPTASLKGLRVYLADGDVAPAEVLPPPSRRAAVHLVQATLGHSSVATTGQYLHARPTESSSKYLAV